MLQRQLNALFVCYFEAAKSASRTLGVNWFILPASLVLFAAFILSAALLGDFGLVGGFILGIIQICLLTYYYAWIYEACASTKGLAWRELGAFDTGLFFSVISAAFFLFLLELIIETVLKGVPDVGWILSCFHLAILLLFNPLPEIIQQQRSEGIASLSQAWSYATDYTLEWFLPLLLLILPAVLLVDLPTMLIVFSNTEVLLPISAIVGTWKIAALQSQSTILLLVLGLIVGTWYMFFRAYLFKALEAGRHRPKAY